MRLNLGNGCHHLVQTFLFFILQTRNVNIKIIKTIFLSLVSHECENWSVILREEEHGLSVFENMVPKLIL
jgi:hypothetical protein